MITSNGNQYLPPDYFSLPTTLDAKKSPLALLAQTCSQIGADSSNTKPLLATSEKLGKKSDLHREKVSPSSSSASSRCSPVTPKLCFKPYESNFGVKEQSSVEEKPKSGEMNRKSSTSGRTSNSSHSNSHENGLNGYGNPIVVSSPSPSPGGGKMSRKSSMSAAAGRETPSASSSKLHSNHLPPTSSPLSAAKTAVDSVSSMKSSFSMPTTSTPNFFPSVYPSATGGASSFPLDLMTSSLLGHSLKPSLTPYFNYARSKAAAGGSSAADPLTPVCRDPYCSSCQLSSQLLAASAAAAMAAQNGKSACPAGCTQCMDPKAPGLHGPALAAAAYAQAQLAALAAASQYPYICSWVGNDSAYCGKRFVTSEELLQHLRTHTSDIFQNPSAAAAAHSFLNRAYPTPPLSPLSASRYHPYAKSAFLPPSLFPFQSNPLSAASAIPPAYSPYFLYGSKMGAAPHH